MAEGWDTGERRPTITDVAAAAGSSRSVTARALRGEGYVAAAVRERVLAAAEQLGYVPHAMASSLRSQESRSVGVLVSDLRDPFYANLAAGIAHRARENGYMMFLVDTRNSAEEELEAARTFVGMRVAGVVATPLTDEISGYFAKQRTPIIEVDRTFSQGRSDSVLVNNAGASQRVSDLLIALGHRRIAMLTDETNWTTGAERFEGYRSSLEAAGLEVDPRLIVTAGSDVEESRSAVVDLLTGRDRPTAVFSANGVLAEGLWRAATDLGLRVPDDLSIVSFDDAPWMSMVTPGVTAVAQDTVAMGEAAMSRLLVRMHEPEAAVQQIVVDARIVARGSTAAPRPE
ncbi:LacI family DNA-binding transcriptional regulator [Diaminobutyricibacter sp. McL0618]|uniref:LacI family DNA-binding transcriptional regulator n=1 Tax=Leifsonia sp. McL0618 TaxID=3415677 RepID=UPI003CEDD405